MPRFHSFLEPQRGVAKIMWKRIISAIGVENPGRVVVSLEACALGVVAVVGGCLFTVLVGRGEMIVAMFFVSRRRGEEV